LGLAITKSIVEAHGEKIKPLSTTEGNHLEVRLPLKTEVNNGRCPGVW